MCECVCRVVTWLQVLLVPNGRGVFDLASEERIKFLEESFLSIGVVAEHSTQTKSVFHILN